jgi:multidrug efflux system membrane fusion protein
LRASTRWRRAPRTFALVISVILGALASGCAKEQAAPPRRPPIPVVVGTVIKKTVPVEISAIGNVEAYSTVSIKAQIAGELLEVHFKEGDFVHKGQLLLTIDPRPYEAALAQAKAALARDKAVAVNNHAQAERYLKLLAAGVVPAQATESFTSAADASDAVVSADEAAIQTAQINLDFCKIYSPLDGRTGYLMLKPGNLLKVADVPIVVINQVNPIFVNFTVPQQFLADIQKYMAQGELKVIATVPNAPNSTETGALTFVDNNVDTTTGTIHLRATFANTRNQLWPGLYANVVLELSKEADRTVVPAEAITTGQKGTFVYVVEPGGTVAQRLIASSRTVDGEAVIEKGLQPGETVVVDGQSLLAPGVKVAVKNSQPAASPRDQPARRQVRPEKP